jgi:hypothetical protein
LRSDTASIRALYPFSATPENTMPENLSDKIAALAQLNVNFRQQLEQSELHVPRINEQIAALAALGGHDQLAIEGDVVLQRPYLPQFGPSDSGQIYQAVLLVPEGIGVVIFDLEDYLYRRDNPQAEEFCLSARFQGFDLCSSFLKAALLPQVESLVSRLLLNLGI